MNSDHFEQRLQRQPLRQIPTEWRAEILSKAHHASRITHHALVAPKSDEGGSRLLLARHNLNPQLSTLNSPLAFAQGLGEPGRDLAAAADSECFHDVINLSLSPGRSPDLHRKGSWLGGSRSGC